MPEQLLKRQTLERIATGLSLIRRAFGFSIFGTLIIANWHQVDPGTIDRDLHKFHRFEKFTRCKIGEK